MSVRPCGRVPGPPKFKPAGDDDLRQSNRAGDAVPDAVVDWIERCRRERPPDQHSFGRTALRSAAHCRTMCVSFDRRDAQLAGATPGRTRECCCPASRLVRSTRCARHRTPGSRSFRPALLPNVDRPGSCSSTAGGRADEAGRAVRIEEIGRGISGISRRTAGSVALARCASLSTRLFMSTPCRCRMPLVGSRRRRCGRARSGRPTSRRTGCA